MKKTQKLISAFVISAAMLCLSLSSVSAAWNFSASFDDAELITVDGVSQTVEGFWCNLAEGQQASIAEAPSAAKYDGSSLSNGDGLDKAALLCVPAIGSTGTPYMQYTFGAGKLAEMSVVRIAFNTYIDAASASYAPLVVSLRTKSAESTLVSFRANGNVQFNGSSAYQQSYSKKSWHYCVFDIDTASKTYTAYIDGVKYGSIEMSNSSSISFEDVEAIRFAVNTAANASSSYGYFDDLYIGEPYSNSTDTIIANSLALKNEAGTELTEIAAGERSVTAVANVTYSEKTEELPVRLYTAVYSKLGELKQVFAKDDIIPAAEEAGEYDYEISNAVTIECETGDIVRTFLWDKNMQPLIEKNAVKVTDGIEYIYRNDFELKDLNGITMTNTGSEDTTYMTASFTDTFGDALGNVLYLYCANMPGSGFPYITIPGSSDTAGKKVNVDFRLRIDTKMPRLLQINGKFTILEFRPTGIINVNGTSTGKKYTSNVWTSYHIELDFAEQTYVVYMEEEKLAEGTLTETQLTNLRFTIQRNNSNPTADSQTYLDDIKIYY